MDRNTGSTGSTDTWTSRAGATEGETAPAGGMTEVAGQAKQALTQTAQDTMETAKSAGKEIADTAQQQIAETVEQAVSQTTDTIAQVKEQASSVFVDQRDRAASGLSGLADALRETGKTLAQQADKADDGAGAQVAAIGPFIEDLADRLASSSDYLKDKDVTQLIKDAEELARKQPLLFVGALFGVGVVGARLLKGTLGSGDNGSQSSGQSSGSTTDWSTGTGWGAESGQGADPMSLATQSGQSSHTNQRTGYSDSVPSTGATEAAFGGDTWTTQRSSGVGSGSSSTMGDPS